MLAEKVCVCVCVSVWYIDNYNVHCLPTSSHTLSSMPLCSTVLNPITKESTRTVLRSNAGTNVRSFGSFEYQTIIRMRTWGSKLCLASYPGYVEAWERELVMTHAQHNHVAQSFRSRWPLVVMLMVVRLVAGDRMFGSILLRA